MRILLIMLLACFVSACGGGGGSSSNIQLPDADNDTIADSADNCPNTANTDQLDTDVDGMGDACDSDDYDGIADALDVDRDNDGLIEVANLQQLDWMRHDLIGSSRNNGAGNVDNNGCPVSVCNGYELIADLNFDTTGDGFIDANDTYYDYDGDGSDNGWLPVGTQAAPFMANFNGNNHSINLLFITASPAMPKPVVSTSAYLAA
jgi:hypothetical protein